MPKRNYIVDVAFTVEGEWDSFDKIPHSELIAGLDKRLNHIKANPNESAEAFGCFDDYEVPQ